MKKPSDKIADEFLVLRAQEGDAGALDALLRRWQERLWLLARRCTNDQEAANDVLQNSLIAVARSIGKLADPAQFRSWAFRIVSNKSRDWIRTQQRRRKLVESAAETEAHGEEAVATADDARDVVRRSLEKLPGEQQSILTLFYIEEMSVAEISGALDLAAGTVKSRLFTARNQLKEIITHQKK